MDIAGFNEARLAAQYATYGEPAVIGGLSCVVCASGHRGRGTLEEGGMGITFDRTVRARIGDFTSPPKIGGRATVGGTIYRIEEVQTQTREGEYVMGLTQAR